MELRRQPQSVRAEHHSSPFQLPSTITLHQRFSGIDDVKKAIAREAKERKLHIIDDAYCVTTSSRQVTFKCKYCSSHITLSSEGDKLKVTALNPVHSGPHISAIEQEFRKWLGESGSVQLKNRVEWRSQDPSLPASLVASTTSMKQHYDQFGGLLCFTRFYFSMEGISQVGVFSVSDYSMRPLLVGFALLEKLTPVDLCVMFNHFFSINPIEKCLSILTRNDELVKAAILLLKESRPSWKIAHLIDPKDFLEVFETSQELDYNTKDYVMKNPHTLVISRRFRSSGPDQQVLHLLRKAYATFCNLPSDAYVGPYGYSCRPIEQTCFFFRELEEVTSLRGLVLKLIKLANMLAEASLNSFEPLLAASKTRFNDSRLKELFGSYEKEVLTRFMENYELSEQCLISREVYDSGVFTCYLTVEDESYEIRNWKCQCGEDTQTGVACPHVIKTARSVRDKSYTELISPIWRRPAVTLDD